MTRNLPTAAYVFYLTQQLIPIACFIVGAAIGYLIKAKAK